MSSHHLAHLSHVRMPQARKLVLLCLADDAGAQTGVAIPGLEELMAWSGLGRSATLDALTKLIDDGYIERLASGSRGHRAEFRVQCPCPDHSNGSGSSRTLPETKGPERVQQAPDPNGAEDAEKGPERVRQLADPLKPSSFQSTSNTGTPDPSPRKGSRLPADWSPTTEHTAYATSLGFAEPAIARMAEDFRDYWVARAGQQGVKLDWLATWRTWVRREADRQGVKPVEQQAAERPKVLTYTERRAQIKAEQDRQMAILRGQA